MASSLYKWSTLLLFTCLFLPATAGTPHPLHLSVLEVAHNPAANSVEISCRIFYDDFEKVLKQNYKTAVNLYEPTDRPAMDKLVADYLNKHISIKADGKLLNFNFLGFERDDLVIYSYIEIPQTSAMKKVDLVNTLMHDLFDDQQNMIHVTVNGKRQSTKLDYPRKEVSFLF